ncbi:M56 family metallopeptidase [Longimicrobium terrae]|uniref:Peptidase M56 domain-containing protein n=1 Tax=Longimicrobium terrae TaxID=1639882 RepID=A0A841H0J9_9BACT|nr:M56 family metallopeptidase [Longimicrobium terrae]MBB4637250.1 hypothetical protein [Longimicrobium terrae]MBB6071488.1 hypothetical protein [Longimicrobium terrae]NNC30089.1 M56 family metallopeptidase [Longimicrobium terrae]
MMLHWMGFCLAVGALLCAGAMALEAALRTLRLPARWVWSAALVLSLAIPAASRWMPQAPQPVENAAAADQPPASTETGISIPLPAARGMDVSVLNAPLRTGWMLASGAAALAWLAAWAALERRRRGWSAERVDGVDVLVSERTGPAVVGLLRGRIVVPAWVLRDTDADARALLLEHEAEHLRAGDPRLLALALVCVTLMPWSPAAWWQLRRLRLAMEVDCDSRVLARRADVRGYGTLLLEVGRRAAQGRLPTLAFSEPASFLERRIRMMTTPPARAPLPRAAALCALSLALLAAACEAPGPVNPSPASRDRVFSSSGGGAAQASLTPREAMQRYYPEVIARGPGSQDQFVFVIGADGAVQEHRRAATTRGPGGQVQVSGLDELQASANLIASVDVMKMTEGQMGPGALNIIWVQMKGEGEAVAAAPAGGASRVEFRVTETVPTAAGSASNITIRRTDAAQSASPADARATEVTIRATGTGEARATSSFTSGAGTAQQVDAGAVRAAVQQHMPGVAANGTTSEYVWFVANAAGQVVSFGETTSGMNGAINPDNIASVQVFKGESMTINGHEVPVIWAVSKN